MLMNFQIVIVRFWTLFVQWWICSLTLTRTSIAQDHGTDQSSCTNQTKIRDGSIVIQEQSARSKLRESTKIINQTTTDSTWFGYDCISYIFGRSYQCELHWWINGEITSSMPELFPSKVCLSTMLSKLFTNWLTHQLI